MPARLLVCIMVVAITLFPQVLNASGGALIDAQITPEAVLDGMIHFEADQGIKDYKVKILQVTRDTESAEIVQVEKELYFMAPNILLTLEGGEPKSFSDDTAFQVFLSAFDLKRDKDVTIRDEDCFKVIATPKGFGLKKYTKTYFVSKKDYRKLRIESVRSEVGTEFIHYDIDYYYDEVQEGDNTWDLTTHTEVIAADSDGKELLTQTNTFSDYEFNLGLTLKFFEKKLGDYKTYYSEGT